MNPFRIFWPLFVPTQPKTSARIEPISQSPTFKAFRFDLQKAFVDGSGPKSRTAFYVFHTLKTIAYYAIFAALRCIQQTGACTPLQAVSVFTTLTKNTFIKLLIFNIFCESVHISCSSGPLSLKFEYPWCILPWHALTRGTLKIPVIKGLNTRRTIADVVIYVVFLASLVVSFFVERNTMFNTGFPVIVLLSVFYCTDRSVFLASRPEHYGYMLVAAMLCDDAVAPHAWVVACQIIQIAVWFWAGVSKFGPWFDHMMPIMNCTNPMVTDPEAKKKMFRNYPYDYRPSSLGKTMSRLGSTQETIMAILVCFGPTRFVGGCIGIFFHSFIITQFALATVNIWNVSCVIFAYFLFIKHGDVLSAGSVANDLPIVVQVLLFFFVFLVPLIGQFAVDRVCFLTAYRYYAGNWPTSMWFLSEAGRKKIQETYPTLNPISIRQQLRNIGTSDDLAFRMSVSFLAFRWASIVGPVYTKSCQFVCDLCKTRKNMTENEFLNSYNIVDGESLASNLLGWSFGTGLLHDENLMRLLAQECGFEEGDVYCIFAGSISLCGKRFTHAVYDAAKPFQPLLSELLDADVVNSDEYAAVKVE